MATITAAFFKDARPEIGWMEGLEKIWGGGNRHVKARIKLVSTLISPSEIG